MRRLVNWNQFDTQPIDQPNQLLSTDQVVDINKLSSLPQLPEIYPTMLLGALIDHFPWSSQPRSRIQRWLAQVRGSSMVDSDLDACL